MNILYFFLYLKVIFALLDPDPDPATQINADPCGSPQPCKFCKKKFWYGSGSGFSVSEFSESGSETMLNLICAPLTSMSCLMCVSVKSGQIMSKGGKLPEVSLYPSNLSRFGQKAGKSQGANF